MIGFLFDVLFYLLLALLIWHLLTRKYLNPYKLTFVFGKKGSGKNTYLAKIAYQHMAKGWRVYSNVDIPGCYQIDSSDIGKFMIPRESVVLLDEVGLIWHSRDHKTFPKHVLRWFKLQRHYGVKVYMTSQDFDCDKALRILADDMYLLVAKLRVWSYGKRIIKYPDLVSTSGEDSEKRLADQLKFDSLLFFWCGSRILTWIPRWVKYFDSFYVDPLPEKEFPVFAPDKAPRRFRPKKPKKRLSFSRSVRAEVSADDTQCTDTSSDRD